MTQPDPPVDPEPTGRVPENRGRGSGRSGLFSLAQIRHLMRVEFARAERYGYELAVLAVGVDDRIELRRRGGDDLAAEAVDAVVELLGRTTRSCDHLGRLVDDRFLAVLPHTGTGGARVLADRWREEASRIALGGGGIDRLRLSVGVCVRQSESTLFFDLLVEEAVAALDRAQRAGGGRVEVAREGDGS